MAPPDHVKAAIEKLVDAGLANATTVADMWALFEAVTMPTAAGAVQRRECRRAFYAGAAALLQLVMQMAGTGIEEEASIRRLTALEVELREFGKGL